MAGRALISGILSSSARNLGRPTARACRWASPFTQICVRRRWRNLARTSYGSEFLEPSLRGEYVGCIGVTEPDAGSDVASIRTRAVADGDDWVITGRKLYITNGTQADWVCLLARTSEERGYHGMSLIIVPSGTPGFSVSRKLRKLGNLSSDTAELVFDGARVPRANTIGPEGMGFILQMQQFQRERLVGAILAYSSMEKVVRQTIEYTRQRQTFGAPLIDNQVVHFRMAELLTEIEALKALCYTAVETMVEGRRHHPPRFDGQAQGWPPLARSRR